jgi:mannose-6-phosphate isomerase-like protein (cupin superfamily)
MTTTQQVTTEPGLAPFTAKGLPVLSDGTITVPLAVSENLWVHAKVYSEGGENSLHCHPKEDHGFVVLQGSATFVDAHGTETVVGVFDGILIPKGVLYRFESGGGENLVMLRFGGGQRSGNPEDRGTESFPGPMMDRRDLEGRPQAGDAAENRTASRPPVVVSGRAFGA